MTQVFIPAPFIDDARDSIECRIDQGAPPEWTTLFEKMTSGAAVRRGGGWSVLVDLTRDELLALTDEAQYRDEYWNTDAYGVKESGCTIRQYAGAARRLSVRLGEEVAK
jgi:hypothetical protein